MVTIYSEYEHLSFLWGRGIDKVVFPGVLGLLNEYSEYWADASTSPGSSATELDSVKTATVDIPHLPQATYASQRIRTVPWISPADIDAILELGQPKPVTDTTQTNSSQPLPVYHNMIYPGRISMVKVLKKAVSNALHNSNSSLLSSPSTPNNNQNLASPPSASRKASISSTTGGSIRRRVTSITNAQVGTDKLSGASVITNLTTTTATLNGDTASSSSMDISESSASPASSVPSSPVSLVQPVHPLSTIGHNTIANSGDLPSYTETQSDNIITNGNMHSSNTNTNKKIIMMQDALAPVTAVSVAAATSAATTTSTSNTPPPKSRRRSSASNNQIPYNHPHQQHQQPFEDSDSIEVPLFTASSSSSSNGRRKSRSSSSQVQGGGSSGASIISTSMEYSKPPSSSSSASPRSKKKNGGVF
jgi:hypothetical protein